MIGVFDSGLGGLTALRELRLTLPEADLVYFGDTARIPYGTRSKEVIDRYALQDCAFLVSLGVGAILAACGTVSSNSLPLLRSRFDNRIFGVVEGAVKKAARCASERNGRVLVLGTEATIRSGAFEKALKDENDRLEIYSAACPMFVPMAESWRTSPDDEAARAIACEYLSPFTGLAPAAVILGCTHYPLLQQLISLYLPESELVNSGKEAANMLKESLSPEEMRGNRSTTFYTSDDKDGFGEKAKRFLGSEICGQVFRTDVESIRV